MSEQKMQIDDLLYYLTSANIQFDEEQFILNTISNKIVRSYILSPKHAKRLLLLLQKKVEQFENTHGTLETSLPQGSELKQTSREFGFQDLPEEESKKVS